MEKVTTFMLLVGIMLMAVPAFAQDFGTEIQLNIPIGEIKRLQTTDWSSDGQWIAFGKIMHVDETYHTDIMLVPVEDGRAVNITSGIDYRCYIPSFTPDSRNVVFTREITEGEGKARKLIRHDLESIDIYSGDHDMFLTDAFAGSFSADGRFLACGNHNLDTSGYYLYDLENEKIVFNFELSLDYITQQKTGLTFTWGHPAVDLGNNHILTTIHNHSDEPEVMFGKMYSISILTGELESLELGKGDPFFPKFSPDGKWMLYSMFDYTEMDVERNMPSSKVQIYNTETGEILDLLKDNSYFSSCASWSPDGSKICYILDAHGDYSLYIKDFEDAIKEEEIQVSVDDELPSGFALKGNYPNPFNPETTIEFSLHESGFAGLTIYNLAGQKVRELVSGTLSEGVHSVVWNGLNDNGLPVSAGLYMSRLTMGDAVTTGRMVLVK